MKNQLIVLKNKQIEHYQRELRTSELIRYCYQIQCKEFHLTPEKLYALCKLTWLNGNKVPALYTLWEKKLSEKKIRDINNNEFPPIVYRLFQNEIGFVNYYPPFRNSSFTWINRNFKSIAPLVKIAARLNNDKSARELVRIINELPEIPKPSNKGGKINAKSLLTPLFACLDPRHRFPIINKATHVKTLHQKLGITKSSIEDQFNTLVGHIGQFGIKDALMLDVASNQIAELSLIKFNVNAKNKLPIHVLNEKVDTDVDVIIKSHSIKAVRLHNSMTNRLTELCKKIGYKVLEGSDPFRFDALIENYNDKGKDLLLEAKSSCQRAHLRLAVGQLFDYRRGLPRRSVTDIAVLLPEKPDIECINYLNDVGVYFLWFTNSTLKLLKGNLELKIIALS